MPRTGFRRELDIARELERWLAQLDVPDEEALGEVLGELEGYAEQYKRSTGLDTDDLLGLSRALNQVIQTAEYMENRTYNEITWQLDEWLNRSGYRSSEEWDELVAILDKTADLYEMDNGQSFASGLLDLMGGTTEGELNVFLNELEELVNTLRDDEEDTLADEVEYEVIPAISSIGG